MKGMVPTFHDRGCVVFPVSEARNKVFYPDPSLKFFVKEVTFVQEENNLRLCEHWRRANRMP